MILRRAFSIFQSGFQFIPRIFYIIRVCMRNLRKSETQRSCFGRKQSCLLIVCSRISLVYPVGIVLNDIVLKAREWLLILCSMKLFLACVMNYHLFYSVNIFLSLYLVYTNILALGSFYCWKENDRIHNQKSIIGKRFNFE